MEEYKQIGLNIWGICGGFECFCHSDNLDINTPEIANTWSNIDIREIVYVSNLSVRFYALEFTPNYKVFTIYRPEYDASGRSGAYVATTLYVPHVLKINNILDLLKQISDAYHKDHYDAFGNPNNAPAYIQVYLEIVKNFSGNIVREEVVRPWDASAQNKMPCLLPFSNLDVVAKFFATPYRNEFKLHQEVMFWDVTHVQNPQLFGVKFMKTEIPSFKTDGEGIAGQFEGGRILNDPPAGLNIASFRREGTDITSNWRSTFFYDDTSVEIEFRRPFYMPLKYNGPIKGFGACPFLKQGDDYRFSGSISLQPCQYELQIRTPDVLNMPFELLIGSQSVAINGGMGKFRFEGRQANETFKVSLKQGDNQIKVGEVRPSQLFKNGSDAPDPMMSYTIEGLKSYRFRFNKECRGKLRLSSGEQPISFVTGMNNVFDIVLPASVKPDFMVVVDGYEAKLQSAGGNIFDVTLTPNTFNAEVVVPDDLKRFLNSSYFVLKADGEIYRTAIGSLVFAGLPKKAKGVLQSTFKLDMSVNGATPVPCKCTVKDDGHSVRLYPELMLVNNETNEKAEIIIADIPIRVVGGSQFVMPLPPDNFQLRISSTIQEMLSKKNGYHLLTLKKKITGVPVTSTDSTQTSQQGGKTFGSGHTGAGNRKILGFYRFDGTERKLYEDECTLLAEGVYSFKLIGKTCTLCFTDRLPDTKKQKQQDDKNKDNGFSVRLGKTSAKVFEVEAIPEKKQSKTGKTCNGKRRWWFFGGLGLAALLLVSAFFFLGKGLMFGKSKYPYTLIFEGNHESYIEVSLEKCIPIKTAKIPIKTAKNLSKREITLKPECDTIKVMIKSTTEGEKDTTICIKNLNFNQSDTCKTLCVNTLAWDKVQKFENNIDSLKFLFITYNSDSIKKKCANYAFNLLRDTASNETLDNYKYEFPSYNTAKIDTLIKKNKVLSDFNEALTNVWSNNCSLSWINKLDSANKNINKYPDIMSKKNNVVKNIIGDAKDSVWVSTLITNQRQALNNIQNKKFLELTILINGRGAKGSSIYSPNHKDYFSEGQIEVLNKLIVYKDLCNSITDTTAYSNFIKEN